MSGTDENKANADVADRLDGVVMRISGWIGKCDYATLEDDISTGWHHDGDKTIAPTLYKTRGNKADWPDFEWPPRKITIAVSDA